MSCPFGQYTRLPKLAKPVSIPVVPGVIAKRTPPTAAPKQQQKEANGSTRVTPKGEEEEEEVDRAMADMAASLVVENSSHIVLDFSSPGGDKEPLTGHGDVGEEEEEEEEAGNSIYSSGKAEIAQIISKVKDKTSSFKKTITPTLKRKKSNASTDTTSTVAGMSLADLRRSFATLDP